jgi:hypothetical protein
LLAIAAVKAGSTLAAAAVILETAVRAVARNEMTGRIGISSKGGRGILRDREGGTPEDASVRRDLKAPDLIGSVS